MKCNRFVFAVLVGVTLTAAAPAGPPIDPNNPPQGRFVDDWAEVHLLGAKVGYMHTAMTRDGDIVRTENDTVMRIGRVDQRIEVTIRQATEETLAGMPRTFASEMNAATVKTGTRGAVNDGKVSVTTSQYGMEQNRTFDFPEGALMTWGLLRESLNRGYKPGTEYVLDVYAPDLRLDGPVKALTLVGDDETFDHRGETRKGRKVTLTMRSPIGMMTLESWVNKYGDVLKAVMPAPGLGDMVLYTVDQQTALSDFVPPEIFMKSTIKADRKLEPRSLRRVVYRLRPLDKGADLNDLPEFDGQKVTRNADGTVDVAVTRLDYSPADAMNEKSSKNSAAMAEYLESNLMINIDDAELIKLGKRAADGAKEPFALADRLRRFVSEYVKSKTLNIGFATASEVARTREGDCSEHGVLLAALGRLNEIPSRVAVGLVYVPSFAGQSDIFGYHMWTQFYLDGRWLDYDAALNETRCSPTRIAFSTSSLRNTGLADLSLPLLSKIGTIGIEIVEVDLLDSDGGNSD
jgi:transglutaminase-like putative cysteine protease